MDEKLQRGLLLAEIEEAEIELERLSDKATRLTSLIHAFANAIEDSRPQTGPYNHERAQMVAQRRLAVTREGKYKDAMEYETGKLLMDEIDAATRTLAELKARKSPGASQGRLTTQRRDEFS